MTKIKLWYILIIGIAMLFGGVSIYIATHEFLFPSILIILGLEIVVIESIRKLIFKKSSLKLLGIGVVIFSILNLLNHYSSFELIARIEDVYKNNPSYFNFFFIKEGLNLFFTLWLLFIGKKLILAQVDLTFSDYIKSSQFKILVVIIITLLILEVPVFGIHGDFGGGLHGHDFWDGGNHLH